MLHIEWDFEVEKEVVAEERAIKIARRMKARGVDIATIIDCTDLTVGEILRL